MREILFRAFVKDKGKVYNIKQIDFGYGMVWFEEENKPTDTMRMFDQIELMQFTGLTDKNGKMIFEGDIVATHDGKTQQVIEWTSWDYPCEYDNVMIGTFMCKDKQGEYFYISKYDEVIGNIHDNKELLGEEQ